MATPWLTDTFKPLDTSVIQGAPHALPQKFNDWLPKFFGINAITTKVHLSAFFVGLEDNVDGVHEDVSLKLFVKFLEREPSLWFERFLDKSIKKWNDLITPFLKTWDTKTNLSSFLTAMLRVKKKESETIIEFNMDFKEC